MSEHRRVSHIASSPIAHFRQEAARRQAEMDTKRQRARQAGGRIALETVSAQAPTSVTVRSADEGLVNGQSADCIEETASYRFAGVSVEPLVLWEVRLHGIAKALQTTAESPALHAFVLREHFCGAVRASEARLAHPIVSHLVGDTSLDIELRSRLAATYNGSLQQLNLAAEGLSTVAPPATPVAH